MITLKKNNRLPGGWLGVAAVTAAALAPLLLGPFYLYQSTMILVWGLAILGYNFLTGYTGQISIAHNAFIAIGAYTSAIMVSDFGWHYLAPIPVAGALCFAAGLLLGTPALRLKGFYLATVTLALAIIVPPLAKRLDFITHGVDGILVARPKAPEFLAISAGHWRYIITLAVVVLCYWAVSNVLRGHVGRAFIAMRDNELVAESNGVDLARYKTFAFAVCAALAGVAGSLYAINVGLVAPDAFAVHLSINLLAAAVVGGISSVAGAMLGAAFLIIVPEAAGEIDQSVIGVIFGLTIIVFMLFMPAGIIGLWWKLTARLKGNSPARAGVYDKAEPEHP